MALSLFFKIIIWYCGRKSAVFAFLLSLSLWLFFFLVSGLSRGGGLESQAGHFATGLREEEEEEEEEDDQKNKNQNNRQRLVCRLRSSA